MSDDGAPQEGDAPQVLGLEGTPIGVPRGTWLAAVDAEGRPVRTEDGLLVRVRPS